MFTHAHDTNLKLYACNNNNNNNNNNNSLLSVTTTCQNMTQGGSKQAYRQWR